MSDGSFLGGPGIGGPGFNGPRASGPTPNNPATPPSSPGAGQGPSGAWSQQSQWQQTGQQSGQQTPGQQMNPQPYGAQPYSLVVRDSSLSMSVTLLLKSLPYAIMRFAVLFGFSIAGIIWLVVTFGGAAWLGTHVAQAFGWVWLIGSLVGTGWLWGTVLRYILYLIECGHVAVLTELITRGQVGNGNESQFEYGRRIVTERFGQVNALFGLDLIVRGVINAFHATLDFVAELLPIPGLQSLSNLATMILRGSTRYLDKVVLSYNLARRDENPWSGARDGIVLYCQNAMPILKTSVWMIILEKLLSVGLWVLCLAPAAAVTVMLPSSVREVGGIITVLIAVLFAANLRAAFLKPIFLIMIMVRYHVLIENQPINQEWVSYLDGMSDKFRSLGQQAAEAFQSRVPGFSR